MTSNQSLLSRAKSGARRVGTWVKHRKEWFDSTAAGRALTQYSKLNGSILAAGIAYSSLTSIGAGLLLAATVAAFLLGGNEQFRESLVEFLADVIPGIFPSAESPGLVEPDALVPSAVTGAVGVFALLMLARTATGYLGGLRAAVTALIGGTPGNALGGKLREFATLLGLAVTVVTGAALQVLASSFARTVAEWLGEDDTSQWVVRIPALVAGLLANAIFVSLVYVVLGRARSLGVPMSALWRTIAVVALAIATLQQASTLLVGGAANNPVLAPFAAVLILLVFVDWVSRVLLIGAAWLGVVRAGSLKGADPRQ